MKNTEITYKIINDELINIFKNVDSDIRKLILKNKNIVTRNSKISYSDAFLFSLLRTQIYKSDTQISCKLNFLENKHKFERSNLSKKSKNIPLEFYYTIFNNLKTLFYKYFDSKTQQKIIAIDGTFNNVNTLNIKDYLETALNIGMFNVTDDIPFDLTFKGIENKNREINSVISYVTANPDKLKNFICIFDRGYCSYGFVNFLEKHKIKYIIRFKNNCKKINQLKNSRLNTNIIFYNKEVENLNDNFTINNNKFKSVTLTCKDEYNIITNLDKSYTNKDIIELYKKRWNVEVFFKIIKSNFKFSNLRITSENEPDYFYTIHNIKILIIYLLSAIFERTYEKINNIQKTGTIIKRINKKTKKNTKNINKPKIKNIPNVKNNKDFDITNSIKNINFTINTPDNYKNNNQTPQINKNNNQTPQINKNNNKTQINKNNNETQINKNNNETLINKKINEIEIKINNETEEKTEINKNNNIKECNIKVNKSLSLKCTFLLSYYTINNILTPTQLEFNLKNSFIYVKTESDLFKKRTCKTPFYKWYIKGYVNKSDYFKIICYILKFTDTINKNLKVISKRCTITNISYK